MSKSRFSWRRLRGRRRRRRRKVARGAAMLGEGFLRVLRYREERKFAEGKSKIKDAEGDSLEKGRRGLDFATTATGGHEAGISGLQHATPAFPKDPTGLLIPGRPSHNAAPIADPFLADCLVDCSLLEHYPDLQVADSGPLPALPKSSTPPPPPPPPPQPLASPPVNVPTQPSPAPDQGYLVMGGSVNVSLDVPELRTNSVLNGMLERKLEEVYLQHLTDNLARCDSDLGNSLLRGLVVPPPQPATGHATTDSLLVSVGDRAASSNKTISYLNTSTNFSSPVLRISQDQN